MLRVRNLAELLFISCSRSISTEETRHACDQGDGLGSYTWTKYDAREGGTQVIEDPQNNVRLITSFLKVPSGSHGGSWAARIKGEPIDPGMCHGANHERT